MDEFSLPFISWRVVGRMLKVLSACDEAGTVKPKVYLHNHGGIHLVWEGSRSVEVDLLNLGTVVCSTSDGSETTAVEIAFDPDTIVGVVAEWCFIESESPVNGEVPSGWDVGRRAGGGPRHGAAAARSAGAA